jgi:hypothetical protein
VTLREQQSLFVRLVGLLIERAYQLGYELTFGEAYRTPEQAARNAIMGIGTRNSLHVERLAVDFNLFRDGQFLSDSRDHAELGEYWKSLHPLCRWGGDFTKPDGNHYSMSRGGRA